MNEPELNKKDMKRLYKAVLSLQNESECKKFLRDIATFSELKAMSERLAVVEKIDQKIPYRTISKQTGASTATVTRIAHWLHHGMGGYRLVLDRLK